MRKTFIFGNGLGMSISSDAYNLGLDPLNWLRTCDARGSIPTESGGNYEQSLLAKRRADGPAAAFLSEKPWQATRG